MVYEGIVLCIIVSQKGIEVDKAKIDAIDKLPPPANVKGIWSFLKHAGFQRRFINYFFKSLCYLFEVGKEFNFNSDCLRAFNMLKHALTHAAIITTFGWTQPFQLMCGSSNSTVGVVLSYRKGKVLHHIYYVSKTLIETQINYIATEKELVSCDFYLQKV